MGSFDSFRHRFLLAAIREHPSSEIIWLKVGDICEKHGLLFFKEPAAIAAALHLINEEGLGFAEIRDGELQFRFSPKGYGEACRLRERGTLHVLKLISRSDWIALGAFAVSVIALFK